MIDSIFKPLSTAWVKTRARRLTRRDLLGHLRITSVEYHARPSMSLEGIEAREAWRWGWELGLEGRDAKSVLYDNKLELHRYIEDGHRSGLLFSSELQR